MTNKELQIIAELFGTPCDRSPADEEMAEHYSEWCEKNCGQIGFEQCWRKYIEYKIMEKQHEAD